MPWKECCVMDLRKEFILKAISPNVVFKDLCDDYNITTKTGYKWKERFLQYGFNGLYDLKRTPKLSPNQTAEEVTCEIVRIKIARPNWGPKKIRAVYIKNHPGGEIPSLSTFKRVLEKAGLVKKRKKRNRSQHNRIENREPAKAPNDVWTVDFKGYWYSSENEKCEPLTVRDLYSRYILCLHTMENGTAEQVKSVFTALFKKYGLPKVIRTDNGPPFASACSIFGLTKLSVWWLSLGIQLDRIEPGKPQQNGSHERMHLDVKNEIQLGTSLTLSKYQNIFDEWKKEYNEERPHESLGMTTPSEHYKISERTFDEEAVEIKYPLDFYRRKVGSRGFIILNTHKVFVSNVFHGYDLGLIYSSEFTMDVYFDNLRLGEIDMVSYTFTSNANIIDKRSK